MALIYLKEIDLRPKEEMGVLFHFKSAKGLFLFVLLILGIAFAEEYLWEILVWQENFESNLDTFKLQFVLVPLLTVPQFTHYLLDGFIWKSK